MPVVNFSPLIDFTPNWRHILKVKLKVVAFVLILSFLNDEPIFINHAIIYINFMQFEVSFEGTMIKLKLGLLDAIEGIMLAKV